MEEVFQKPISGLTDSLKPSHSAFRAWLRVPDLTAELVQQGGTVSAHDPQVQAIQLLMQRDFEIYYSCVEVPSLWDRLCDRSPYRANELRQEKDARGYGSSCYLAIAGVRGFEVY
jgi:hypothetical protein